ncbi:MAG TPA: ABC transporter permease [Gemmatimonadaceae bacterium]|nr:ABC transporter permease [Gemmatimonadaceae bacterium]
MTDAPAHRAPAWRRYLRFWRPNAEADLDEEIRFHFEMRIEELLSRGRSEAEARAEALRLFGDVDETRARCRELDLKKERRMDVTEVLDALRQDARYALRQARRAPGFTVVALLTLALGIGANAAIFSVVNAVILKPLPYAEPDRLVRVWNSWDDQPRGDLSPAEYLDYRERASALEHLGVHAGATAVITGDGEPELVPADFVSAGVIPALGVAPLVGRTFTPEEEVPGFDGVLLGYGLWQRRYAGSTSVVGQRIIVNGIPRTVMGVMPRGFRLPNDLADEAPGELFLPIGIDPDSVTERGSHFLDGVARLRPGVTVEQASASLQSVARAFVAAFPDDYPSGMRFDTRAEPLRDVIVGDVRPTLLVLLGAVGFVLLIACANLANLLLSRTEARTREIAVRTALGAGRERIVTQLLVESVILALAGGALGVLLAAWGTRALVALAPPGIPRLSEVGIDAGVLGFALGISLVTGLLLGLAPGLHASAFDLRGALGEGGRGATAGRARQALRRGLVVGEVSLALVLLTGAGLLVQSFARLVRVDPGFRAENVLAVPVNLPARRYTEVPRVIEFYRNLQDRVDALPASSAVGAVAFLPLASGRGDLNFEIDGRPVPEGATSPRADWQVVTPGYFGAMGMRLLRGRTLTESDDERAPGAVVITESLARRYWPGEDPIGVRFKLGGEAGPGWVTIVGIVGDVRYQSLGAEPQPEMYLAHAQFRFWHGGTILRAMTLVVRSESDPTRLSGAIRREIRALDPNLPVGTITTMEQVRAESVASSRFVMLLLSIFSGVALAIAAVGIYGVMAYAVAQRTKEIGVRLALGATPGGVMRMVIGQGLVLAAAGVAVGLIAALWLTRLIAGLLFDVSPTDPATIAGVSLMLMAVAFVACYMPARRATRIDPVSAMRE